MTETVFPEELFESSLQYLINIIVALAVYMGFMFIYRNDPTPKGKRRRKSNSTYTSSKIGCRTLTTATENNSSYFSSLEGHFKKACSDNCPKDFCQVCNICGYQKPMKDVIVLAPDSEENTLKDVTTSGLATCQASHVDENGDALTETYIEEVEHQEPISNSLGSTTIAGRTTDDTLTETDASQSNTQTALSLRSRNAESKQRSFSVMIEFIAQAFVKFKQIAVQMCTSQATQSFSIRAQVRRNKKSKRYHSQGLQSYITDERKSIFSDVRVAALQDNGCSLIPLADMVTSSDSILQPEDVENAFKENKSLLPFLVIDKSLLYVMLGDDSLRKHITDNVMFFHKSIE